MLTELGELYNTDKATIHNFTSFYDKHFREIKDYFGAVLEIGIHGGASLKMWRDYFSNAMIYGIDIDEKSLFNDKRIQTFIIDQIDFTSFDKIFKDIKFDLIIDDGSHITDHQIKSFMNLERYVKPGGYYILEDLHTSFMPEYINTNPTAFEFIKNIDKKKYNLEFVKFYENLDKQHNVNCITSLIKFFK